MSIKKLTTFQLNNEIIYVLRTPLLVSETYIFSHLYAITILGDQAGQYNTLTSINHQSSIIKEICYADYDSLLLKSLPLSVSLDNCKPLNRF